MSRHALLLAFGAVPLSGTPTSVTRTPLTSGCPNVIPHEPVLVYEVHGGTLMGPVDRQLTVYSDGLARIVDLSDPKAPVAAVGQADPESVADLALDLERWGGFLNCDASGMVMDVPLHTLTLVSPGTNGTAHTFSWWLPDGGLGAFEFRIEEFVTEVFGSSDS